MDRSLRAAHTASRSSSYPCFTLLPAWGQFNRSSPANSPADACTRRSIDQCGRCMHNKEWTSIGQSSNRFLSRTPVTDSLHTHTKTGERSQQHTWAPGSQRRSRPCHQQHPQQQHHHHPMPTMQSRAVAGWRPSCPRPRCRGRSWWGWGATRAGIARACWTAPRAARAFSTSCGSVSVSVSMGIGRGSLVVVLRRGVVWLARMLIN